MQITIDCIEDHIENKEVVTIPPPDNVMQILPELDDDPTPAKQSFIGKRTKRIMQAGLIYFLFCSGSTDAANIVSSLYDKGVSQNIQPSTALLTISAICAFASSIGLTGEAAFENADEVYKVMKYRALPYDWEDADEEMLHDWPRITRRRERIAAAIAIISTLSEFTFGMIVSYYFITSIDDDYQFASEDAAERVGWAIFSWVIAFGVGATKVLTESIEAYKTARMLIAHTRRQRQHYLSKYFVPIGWCAGALFAAQNTLENYIAAKTMFAVENNSSSAYAIGSYCILNAIPNFCFTGLFFCANAVDDVVGYLANNTCQRKCDFNKPFSFTCAFAVATFLATQERFLNQDFYEQEIIEFKITKHIPTALISSIVCVAYIMIVTASLYPSMHIVMERLTRIMQKGYQRLKGLFETNESDPEAQPLITIQCSMDPIVPPAAYQEYTKNNPHVLFKQCAHRPAKQLEPKQVNRCGIM